MRKIKTALAYILLAILINALWSMIEIVIYGHTNPNTVDGIMILIWVSTIYISIER